MSNQALPFDALKRLGDGTLETTHLPDGSAVMLDMAHNRVLTLSETGAFIVARLQADATLDEHALAEQIAREFEVDAETALRDIRGFLTQLAEALGVGDRAPSAP